MGRRGSNPRPIAWPMNDSPSYRSQSRSWPSSSYFMTYEQLDIESVIIVERTAPIMDFREAADLIAACIERDTDRLLLDTPVLPQAFFELHTRFAGELLQKLQNYRLRTAIVISPDGHYSDRFKEYLLEAKKARYSRLFTARAEALAWLTAE